MDFWQNHLRLAQEQVALGKRMYRIAKREGLADMTHYWLAYACRWASKITEYREKVNAIQ